MDNLEISLLHLGAFVKGTHYSHNYFSSLVSVLSRMIQVAVENKLVKGVKISMHGQLISHIFFVDDTLIVLKADRKNYGNLFQLLEAYRSASGHEVNLHKSSVFFDSNIPTNVFEVQGGVLGMPMVTDPGTYLGILAIWGRSKR